MRRSRLWSRLTLSGDQHCVEVTVKPGLPVAVESKIAVPAIADVNGCVEVKGRVTLKATVFRGEGCAESD